VPKQRGLSLTTTPAHAVEWPVHIEIFLNFEDASREDRVNPSQHQKDMSIRDTMALSAYRTLLRSTRIAFTGLLTLRPG